MKLFLSQYLNRVDKKGRVSVPSAFRSVLKDGEFAGVVVYQSFVNRCIEGCSMVKMEKFLEFVDDMNLFSPEKDIFATVVFGNSVQLPFDNEGRVVLPDELREHAGITDKAAFIGKGSTFEIWEPEMLRGHVQKSLTKAKDEPAALFKLRSGGSKNA